MKRLAISWLTLLLVASAIPALAQTPNPRAEAEWQHYLTKHPGLQQHPEWLLNQNFLNEHPNMTKWLQEHPAVYKQARQQGMWDNQGRWHDAQWWRQNDPKAVAQYHPNWAHEHEAEAEPARGDGDWDEHHHWRAREWWVEHHHEWTEKHHPEWMQSNQPPPAQH